MKAQKKKEVQNYNTPLLWIFLFLCPLAGGYHLQVPFLVGVVLVICGYVQISLRQEGCLPGKEQAYPLGVLLLGYLIAIPFSVSMGMAVVGTLRLLVWMMLYVSLLSLHKKERFFIIDALTMEAVFFSVGYSLAFVSDVLAGRENLNGRVDGLFQYANSWGVYLLCCFVWQLYRSLEEGNRNKKVDLCCGVALLLGILFTGSRGTLVLTLLSLGYVILRKKEHNLVKQYGRQGVLLLLVCFALVNWSMDGLLTFRLSQFTLESSSLNGRLLYWMDGLTMLFDHPLGVGRGGYLYLQPVYQTGIYTSHYVHNEYLQMAIEGGVLAGVGFIWFVVSFLRQKDLEEKQTLILWILALHMVVDFDTQFFFLLAFFTLVGGEEKVVEKVEKSKGLALMSGVLLVVFSFFTLVYQQSYRGNHSFAYALYPMDLSLAENQLLMGENKEEVAEYIQKTTDLSLLAWDYQSNVGQAEDAITAKFAYLTLQKYQKESYENLRDALRSHKVTNPEFVQGWAEKAMIFLDETIKNTSPFAYRIYDVADFSWAEEIRGDFEQIIETATS